MPAKGWRKETARRKKIQADVTEFEYNRIHWLAKTYAGGNIADWVRQRALVGPAEARIYGSRKAKKRPVQSSG